MVEQNDLSIKLTFRQKAFLAKLLDVYREIREPVHYSVIAERLGVSSSTAYDMLRLLEQKGMVSSKYTTPKATSGPGRSNILFSPTTKAIDLLSSPPGESQEEGWEDVKAYIMAGLCQGKASEYGGILRELLARMPRASSPLVRCAEFITALLLTLRQTKHSFGQRSPVSKLLQAPLGRLGMSILTGLALGLCLADKKVKHGLTDLQKQIKRYETSLQRLSPENLILLHRFTLDVWKVLRKAPVR